MARKRLVAMALILGCALAPSGHSKAAPLDVSAARLLLTANQDSLVTVKAVVTQKSSYMGQGMGSKEMKTECSGVVLDGSGLTLVSLFAANPLEIFAQLDFSDGKGESPRHESELSDIKMITRDGVEEPGKIVLRDPDLDLLFIRPVAASQHIQPIRLGTGVEPGILDEVFVIGRLGSYLNREPFMSLARVTAVVRKPRPYYLLDYHGQSIADTAGLPVTDMAGNVIGFLMMRRPAPDQFSGANPFSLAGLLMPVVVPIEDVLETAKQAAVPPPAPLK